VPTSSETAYPTEEDPVNHQHMHKKQKKPWGQHLAYALPPVIKSKNPQSPHAPKMAPFHQSRLKKNHSTRTASTSQVLASTLRSAT